MRMTRLILVMTTLCSLSWNSRSLAANLDKWVADNVGPDRIVCQQAVDGEFFFVAINGARVRLGTRLDVTRYSRPYTLQLEWHVRGAAGESLVAKVAPQMILKTYTQENGQTFAENVEYLFLLPDTKPVKVFVDVSKCSNDACDSKEGNVIHYVVSMCPERALGG